VRNLIIIIIFTVATCFDSVMSSSVYHSVRLLFFYWLKQIFRDLLFPLFPYLVKLSALETAPLVFLCISSQNTTSALPPPRTIMTKQIERKETAVLCAVEFYVSFQRELLRQIECRFQARWQNCEKGLFILVMSVLPSTSRSAFINSLPTGRIGGARWRSG
jgi:hypothetical protein